MELADSLTTMGTSDDGFELPTIGSSSLVLNKPSQWLRFHQHLWLPNKVELDADGDDVENHIFHSENLHLLVLDLL